MDNLRIDPTRNTPEIDFDFRRHSLLIRGESYPENAADFYAPVLAWLEEYLGALQSCEVVLRVDLTYFNSSSTKALFRIFDLLEDASGGGNTVRVRWHYDVDDDNILEFGEDFREDFARLLFELCAKETA